MSLVPDDPADVWGNESEGLEHASLAGAVAGGQGARAAQRDLDHDTASRQTSFHAVRARRRLLEAPASPPPLSQALVLALQPQGGSYGAESAVHLPGVHSHSASATPSRPVFPPSPAVATAPPCPPAPSDALCAAGVPRGLPGSFLRGCAGLGLPLRVPQGRRRRPLGGAGSRHGQVRAPGVPRRGHRGILTVCQAVPPLASSLPPTPAPPSRKHTSLLCMSQYALPAPLPRCITVL